MNGSNERMSKRAIVKSGQQFAKFVIQLLNISLIKKENKFNFNAKHAYGKLDKMQEREKEM